MVVHRDLSLRARIVIVSVAILVLASCGGGSSKPSSSPTNAGGGASGATTTTVATGSGGGTPCLNPAGQQKARVRFVNLFTNSTYRTSDIDVWQGFGGSDPCAKKLATVSFGTASDYVDVTATDESGDWGVVAYVAGSTAKDHEIMTQSETWKGGEVVTIVFQGAESRTDLPASAGGDLTFFENANPNDLGVIATVPGKANLAIGAVALQYVVADGAWRPGAAGHSGCLRASGDTDTTTTNIGGTSTVQYPVDPGSISLALYPSDPGTCAGTPAIGPATIDATAGSRTFVFVYGPDAQHLSLLVLPIAS